MVEKLSRGSAPRPRLRLRLRRPAVICSRSSMLCSLPLFRCFRRLRSRLQCQKFPAVKSVAYQWSLGSTLHQPTLRLLTAILEPREGHFLSSECTISHLKFQKFPGGDTSVIMWHDTGGSRFQTKGAIIHFAPPPNVSDPKKFLSVNITHSSTWFFRGNLSNSALFYDFFSTTVQFQDFSGPSFCKL